MDTLEGKKLVLEPVVKKWSLFSLFFFPAIGGLIFGYDIGATSFVLVQLQNSKLSHVAYSYILDDFSFWRGVITSGSVAGAFLASLIVFPLSDSLGRRDEMLIAFGLYFSGAALEVFAGWPTFDALIGFSILVAGRIIFGMGIGFCMHAAPMYISEMGPSKVRGMLISAKEAMIVLGMVLGYTVGYITEDTVGGWMYTYGVGGVLACLFGAGVFYLPESARWLILQGRHVEGKESLDFVYSEGSGVILTEVLEVAKESLPKPMAPTPGTEAARSAAAAYANAITTIVDETSESFGSTSDNSISTAKTTEDNVDDPLGILLGDKVLPATIAGLGVITLQQISGQPSVLYYAETIFRDAGVSSGGTIAVACFKLLCTIASAFVVDSYGRRKLLLGGILIQAFALTLITSYFAFGWNSDIFLITSMFVYVGGYQVGFGPIAWLLISEVFPLSVRGEGMALAVQTNFFWNLVVALSFDEELELIGSTWSFAVFLIVALVSLVFVYYFVPETKGLSLEEIESMLDAKTFSPYQKSQRNARSTYESVHGEEIISIAQTNNSPA
eukprot:CAMPEP_0114370494 /NCGR_PEP_ID=MMETSP0101-20121206/32550_1 /TAXON_ID=38822 ORGANISM="Pteridomonas danica, Strain PT" /NCGR_SAMPLE_ID=MMETSP0101 /ASSEMBLY_ACC=CAM_ASM_000211 /LENGTH=556 /DNA_ID=CAMNT_0001522047 /DNA_START=37 /DNA_END=1707 /DNA_ORIENTATION=-